MAFYQKTLIASAIALAVCLGAKTQTVYYPAHSSRLLRSTAQDMASLFSRAIQNSHFEVQEYTSLPASGIILIYDSAITDNQLCKVESVSGNSIRFTAAQDNGLIFGIYQYLEELGYKFYQPGSAWEIIPSLNSPYKPIHKSYNSTFKYKSWFISGGHNRWIMDNDDNYGWDNYYGINGHNWALYQRRNGMLGAYRFTGHRGDIMNGDYLTALQNNPCYVACYDGSRAATYQSVPDVNNAAAMQLWSNTIEKKYTQWKNTVAGIATQFPDYSRNYEYDFNRIGIEVPDGSHWGNSKDNSGCSSQPYESESNQDFTLANYTAGKLSTIYPDKHFQVYAYSSHADVPSANISINNQIEIQVVSTAFQNESSPKGLLNRWYKRSGNISEYQYMNIPQWGGETPLLYLSELKLTLQRLHEKHSQGVLWEASPAKFASLPFLWAANRNLISKKDVDSSLNEFCTNMFGPAAGNINKLLHQWSDDQTITVYDFMQDNKYKLPLYFQLLNEAVTQTSNSPEVIKQRIRELKAYLHYMVLYYDWQFDQRTNQAKKDKAASICLYLARTNKLQLVNSYFIILDIVSRYPVTDPFNISYNVNNGTAYNGGQLPLITNNEIDSDFLNDYSRLAPSVPVYDLEDADFITGKVAGSNMIPLEKITVKIGYTNGAYYPNRSEFYLHALTAGNFSLEYTPRFNMPGKGSINFTVESVGKSMEIIEDYSLNASSTNGKLIVRLPRAGIYKLSVVSKYQSSLDLIIHCNGNHFYKNSAYLGNKTDNYRSDLSSLPGFFYVPQGLKRVYFSINNSNPQNATGYATPKQISEAFIFKDSYGNRVEPNLASASDSALFYLDIPSDQSGSFWQSFKMEQYNLCFSNITNMLFYAGRKSCFNTDVKISVVQKGGNCITHLSAVANEHAVIKWEIFDNGRWMYYGNEREIDLPDYVSPNTFVELITDQNCSTIRRIADAPGYREAKQACASGAPLPAPTPSPLPAPVVEIKSQVYPNPSNGIYHINMNGTHGYAQEITILDLLGHVIYHQKQKGQINISNQPAGIYEYRLTINDKLYIGKLIKL